MYVGGSGGSGPQGTQHAYKDHAKNIIGGLRGTKTFHLSIYSVQKYFHTLVLLLILQKLIGIFIVKNLTFPKSPTANGDESGKSALLRKLTYVSY